MTKIYVDIDGVIGDFMHHFNSTIRKGGLDANDLDDYKKEILDFKDWWLRMPVMPDARRLMDFLKPYKPYILSACPQWDPGGIDEKKEWSEKHFNIPNNRIFIVKRSDKQKYAKEGDILIDDYDKNIKEWENAGGTGILHTSAAQTIHKLTGLGFS